jgi:hypothetical protein
MAILVTFRQRPSRPTQNPVLCLPTPFDDAPLRLRCC